MNIISHISPYIIPYLTAAQRTDAILRIQSIAGISKPNLAMLVKFCQLLTATTTDTDKNILLDLIMRFAAAENDLQLPKMFEVQEGEDHCIEITVEPGIDLTGYYLTARNSTDLTLLSANNIAGSAATEQEITIEDLTLPINKFYKFFLNAEHPSGSIASGDVAVVLTDAFFIVRETADAI